MLALLAFTLAAPPTPVNTPFVVVSTAADQPTGKFTRFNPEFTATLITDKRDTKVTDVVSLRRANRALPPFPTGPHLITTNGDRIAGELLGGGGQSLRFVPGSVTLKEDETWLVPLSATAAIWLTDTPADTPPDPAAYPWVEGNKNRDVFRFRNGDTARGILAGLGPVADRPTIQFRPDMGLARAIEAKELAAIVFNPTLAKPRKPKGPYARVVLANGSRFGLTNPTLANGILTGETLFGQKAELPVEAVVALDVFQGKAVYLSDIKPKKVEQGGFLGVQWPWAADRAVNGSPLRLMSAEGVSTFDKGLGTHPRTVLTYDLGGKYRRFEALVGLDPESGVRGRVGVRVLVDGKEQVVPGLGAVTAGTPVPVRIDVSDAKELVLEVNFGPAGSVQADVNWADARLVE